MSTSWNNGKNDPVDRPTLSIAHPIHVAIKLPENRLGLTVKFNGPVVLPANPGDEGVRQPWRTCLLRSVPVVPSRPQARRKPLERQAAECHH